MEQFLPENEYKEVEGRAYLNPQLSVDEANAFIDNLRAVQGQQNQQISNDTQMLGTDVPSNLGGLVGGGNGYFTSRYQTPQTNSAVANLRAAAQASALNQILQDEQAMWKKRYQDAYRAHQRRAYNRAYGGGNGNSGGDNGNTSTWDGEIGEEITDGKNGFTAVSELSLDENDMAAGGKYIVEPGSGNIIRIDDTLDVKDPGYQTVFRQQADGSYAAPVKRNSLPQQSALLKPTQLAQQSRRTL